MSTTAQVAPADGAVTIHPLLVRLWHWLNAFAIVIMIMSGWRIYDASPVFRWITFPDALTIGGWLGGALQWHFAAMWLLMANGLVYLVWGWWSGHFQRTFLPVTPQDVLRDVGKALRFDLPHQLGVYNAVQRFSYIGVIAAMLVTVVAGWAIWKPVQFHELAWLMGGYNGARIVHFFGMAAIVAFLVMHLVLVAIVPSTLLPMFTGWARKHGEPAKSDGSK
jgi:thiosulfate reductase cytochrome b subunit